MSLASAAYSKEPQMFSFRETCILGFLNYLHVFKGVAPTTVMQYLSATRFFLANCNVVTTWIDSSEAIKRTSTGMELMYRAIEGNKKSDTTTFPMCTDMIMFTARSVLDTTTLAGQGEATAMKFASCCLARSCEYMLKTKTDHHVRACDIRFGIYSQTGDASRLTVTADRVHEISLAQVLDMVVTVRSAKNDECGIGSRMCYSKTNIDENARAYDFVTDMFLWAQRARPGPLEPFFSCKRERWLLTSEHLNATLKHTATHYRLDPSRLSTHSLRIGGASMLAAAGVPDSTIMKMGRWKSLAFLGYIRLACASFDKAVQAISSPATLTASQVQQLFVT